MGTATSWWLGGSLHSLIESLGSSVGFPEYFQFSVFVSTVFMSPSPVVSSTVFTALTART